MIIDTRAVVPLTKRGELWDRIQRLRPEKFKEAYNSQYQMTVT